MPYPNMRNFDASEHPHEGARGEPGATAHPAHEMAPNLIATEIAPGGVKMESPRAVFGASSGPPWRLLIFGAVLGLFGGIIQARRRSRQR